MSVKTSPLENCLARSFAGTRQFLLVLSLGALVLAAGCASRKTPAPVSDISSQPPVAGATGIPADGLYSVRRGDTLYSIARAHNMPVERLASLNNISDPTQLAVGQQLRVTSAAAIPPPAPSATTTAVASSDKPSEKPTEAKAEKPKSETTTRAPDANLISWGWPASGEIIQGFSPNSKGIDIGGAVGSPVVAAADGEVMYVGNGVRGLGNLVLIGHGNKFITAYAHNDTLIAQTGKKVKKGEKIATLGQSDTTSPRLHFEIRRDGTPVNPMSYLPAR